MPGISRCMVWGGMGVCLGTASPTPFPSLLQP